MKFLIVGLGNIGPEYENTRHNIGFMVLDHLAYLQGQRFALSKHAYEAEIRTRGHVMRLIKPTTYMNLSGKAIQHWLSIEKLNPDAMLVVTDDLALPFGTLRLKKQGSSGGHNGLKSIETTIQSQQYPRLRFGIGSDYAKGKQVEYVLGRFSADEQAQLQTLIEKATDMILAFAFEGIDTAMNKYN
jgi:PTH1 family peptidyl-tRNA hydrolase